MPHFGGSKELSKALIQKIHKLSAYICFSMWLTLREGGSKGDCACPTNSVAILLYEIVSMQLPSHFRTLVNQRTNIIWSLRCRSEHSYIQDSALLWTCQVMFENCFCCEVLQELPLKFLSLFSYRQQTLPPPPHTCSKWACRCIANCLLSDAPFSFSHNATSTVSVSCIVRETVWWMSSGDWLSGDQDLLNFKNHPNVD